MSTPSEVSRLLTQTPFKRPEAAKAQVFAALNKFEHLYADRQAFTYPNGVTKELIVLKGTIPVSYKAGKYNIPVSVFLPPDFPSAFPVCYLSPTSDMMVKEGECVDGSGRVYLPYLAAWKPGHSKLVKLIERMRSAFSDSCPIFMKPVQPPPLQQPQTVYMPAAATAEAVVQEEEQWQQPTAPPQSLECLICMTGAKVMMCVPCHHVVYCPECRDNAVREGIRDCPICRTRVSDYVRIYL